MQEIIKNIEQKLKVIKGKNYVISNLSKEVINNEMNGWICGQFYPDDSSFRRDDIEIAIKILPPDFNERLHYHLCAFEFVMVLNGVVEYQIDRDRHIMKAGMYYIMKPNTVGKIIKVHKEALVVCIRLPSIPNNKFFVEE